MAPPKKKPRLVIDETKLIGYMRAEKDRITMIAAGSFDTFRRICVDGEETDFVTCLTCNDSKLLIYDTKFGSSRLNNHLASSNHGNKSSGKTSTTTVANYMIKKASMSDRQKISDKIALWCAMDNRPYNIVESRAFKSMIQSIIDVVARNGKLDAQDILPVKATVGNHTLKVYDELKQKLIDHLEHIDYVNCTTDHWKDKISHADYMTVCIHYFNPSTGKLNNRILGSFEVGNKTAALTESKFKETLMEFKLESKLRMVVTDSASAKIIDGHRALLIKWHCCRSIHSINMKIPIMNRSRR